MSERSRLDLSVVRYGSKDTAPSSSSQYLEPFSPDLSIGSDELGVLYEYKPFQSSHRLHVYKQARVINPFFSVVSSNSLCMFVEKDDSWYRIVTPKCAGWVHIPRTVFDSELFHERSDYFASEAFSHRFQRLYGLFIGIDDAYLQFTVYCLLGSCALYIPFVCLKFTFWQPLLVSNYFLPPVRSNEANVILH